MDLLTRATNGTILGTLWTRDALVQTVVRQTMVYQHAQQSMKAIGFSLQDEDASEIDHEDFMRGIIAKLGSRCFFCILGGHFKSDCLQFWDAVADIKHPRHEEALPGVKASKGRLMRKGSPEERETTRAGYKEDASLTEEIREPAQLTAANDFTIDYKAAARDTLNRVQEELATREIEQNIKLKLENERAQEHLNAFEASEVEETKALSSLSMKLNVNSGQAFGMVPQGSKDTVNNLSGGTSGNQEPT